MPKPPLGVLLMAYGTPRRLDEVEAYYTHIRRGRAPSPALLADLVRRYEAIGGVSPLNAITEAQAAGVQRQLDEDGGRPCKVYLGMKHHHPFIADTVRQMADDGIEDAVTLVLAPHYSTMSVQSYQNTAAEAAAAHNGPRLWPVLQWHQQPRFLDTLSTRVRDAMAQFDDPTDVTVLFSAHSLPQRILADGDPYPLQLQETGDAVAARLGLQRYQFAWQSAGRTDEPWLGPDILHVLRSLHDQGQQHVVICPAGFVSDHLEILYDVDIECQQLARELGMTVVRTTSMNADLPFLQTLADIVRDRAAQAGVNAE